jgi:hypothetical protein
MTRQASIAPIRRLLRAIFQPSLGMQVNGVAALMALLGGGIVGMVVTDRARTTLRDNIRSNSLAAADLAGALSAARRSSGCCCLPGLRPNTSAIRWT